ncbi:MAG: hypothetical protein ACE5GX_19865 [Thermoanaerobaculia bacterium]
MILARPPRILVSLLALLGSSILGPAARAQPGDFSVVELPAIPTRMGEFTDVTPAGIDEQGRVIGFSFFWEEANPHVFSYWVGFRFDPQSGTVVAHDPLNGLHSSAHMVNERGMFSGRSDGQKFHRQELFLHTDEGGIDLLRKRSKQWIRRNFQMHSLASNGYLAGLSFRRTGRQAPLLHLGRRGWIDLARRHDLPHRNYERIQVNRHADYAYQTGLEVYAGANLGPPERIGPDGFDFTLEAIGRSGEVIGGYERSSLHKFDVGGPKRPFLYTDDQGFRDILPADLRHGTARWITKDGTVIGTATRVRARDTVFRWRDGVSDWVDLRQVLEDAGRDETFRTAKVVDANSSGAFIAEYKVRPTLPTQCFLSGTDPLFFYFDARQGLVDLQQSVDAAGLDLKLLEVVGL